MKLGFKLTKEEIEIIKNKPNIKKELMKEKGRIATYALFSVALLGLGVGSFIENPTSTSFLGGIIPGTASALSAISRSIKTIQVKKAMKEDEKRK